MEYRRVGSLLRVNFSANPLGSELRQVPDRAKAATALNKKRNPPGHEIKLPTLRSLLTKKGAI